MTESALDRSPHVWFGCVDFGHVRAIMARKLAGQARRSPTYRFSAALEDARRAGLLDGGRTERLSFRAPAALIEAARRVSGARSPTELGILALATLAQPDPVAAFLERTRGKLGKTHALDY
jgi:hypothetical protein